MLIPLHAQQINMLYSLDSSGIRDLGHNNDNNNYYYYMALMRVHLTPGSLCCTVVRVRQHVPRARPRGRAV